MFMPSYQVIAQVQSTCLFFSSSAPGVLYTSTLTFLLWPHVSYSNLILILPRFNLEFASNASPNSSNASV